MRIDFNEARAVSGHGHSDSAVASGELDEAIGLLHDGIAVNEHFGGDGAVIYKHACARLRGHRVQAARVAIPRRPLAPLAQDQEPGSAGSEARGRGGVAMNDELQNLCGGRAARDGQRRSRQADRLRHLARGRVGMACAAFSTEDTGDGRGDWRAGLYGTPD